MLCVCVWGGGGGGGSGRKPLSGMGDSLKVAHSRFFVFVGT